MVDPDDDQVKEILALPLGAGKDRVACLRSGRRCADAALLLRQPLPADAASRPRGAPVPAQQHPVSDR